MIPGVVEPIDEDSLQDKAAAECWPAPRWPQHLLAQILVGEADQRPPVLAGAIGLVGQITLGSGRSVRVSAGIRTRESKIDHFIAAHQTHLSSTSISRGTGFAWGHTDDSPFLIDLAGLWHPTWQRVAERGFTWAEPFNSKRYAVTTLRRKILPHPRRITLATHCARRITGSNAMQP
jgi:hypothetical protein